MKRFLWVKLIVSLIAVVTMIQLSGALAFAATPTSHAEIGDRARLLNDGVGFIDVVVAVRCTDPSGVGTAVVSATQTAAQSGNGIGASGTSTSYPVNCDGKSHTVGIDVPPNSFPGFNLGKASATVTLTAASGTATDTETIRIVA